VASSSGDERSRPDNGRRAPDVAGVGHELINDLAAISTYVSLITGELLTSRTDLTTQLRQDLDQVCIAAERARSLGSLLIDMAMAGATDGGG
jgi:signal transduction histidine kinase